MWEPAVRLRELRERASLSQEDLAAAIGAHRQTIAKLESGEMKLSVKYMRKVAAPLGVEPWEVMNEAPLLSPEEKALLTAWRQLGPEGRALLVRALAAEEALLALPAPPPDRRA